MECNVIKQKNPFGKGDWFMFYCGNCGSTINMNYLKKDRLICELCEKPIEYPDYKETNNK